MLHHDTRCSSMLRQAEISFPVSAPRLPLHRHFVCMWKCECKFSKNLSKSFGTTWNLGRSSDYVWNLGFYYDQEKKLETLHWKHPVSQKDKSLISKSELSWPHFLVSSELLVTNFFHQKSRTCNIFNVRDIVFFAAVEKSDWRKGFSITTMHLSTHVFRIGGLVTRTWETRKAYNMSGEF